MGRQCRGEGLLQYLKGYLKRKGFEFQAQPVDDNRYNLNTVTAYDLEHFAAVEKGDDILGLGAAEIHLDFMKWFF